MLLKVMSRSLSRNELNSELPLVSPEYLGGRREVLFVSLFANSIQTKCPFMTRLYCSLIISIRFSKTMIMSNI